MMVFKFGGASVKNADAVRNLGEIVKSYNDNIVVVISAMGKTTNAMERLLDNYVSQKMGEIQKAFDEVKEYHYNIVDELFCEKTHQIYDDLDSLFQNLERYLQNIPTDNYDYEYDQIVSYGELFSTRIVSAYLDSILLSVEWVDIRGYLKTDNTYRDARIEWERSAELVKSRFIFNDKRLYLTQGFIASTIDNATTTLGREGSDYTAAILANILDAEKVIVWKDVPGVLNADPKYFDDTRKLNMISYHEAIELTYYGATVIHSKTLKPLQNKNIPLYVKSFVTPEEEGTLINHDTSQDSMIPSFIFMRNQILISVTPRDYSFIMEESLSDIFAKFAKHRVKVNLMQSSALSFSFSVNNDSKRIPELMGDLKADYKVLYNEGLDLVTIRHYDQETIDRITKGKEILVEQKSRHTARFVLK